MSLNKDELEWFLPSHYQLTTGFTVIFALCIGVAGFILTLYAIFTTNMLVMQWLTLGMITMLVGMPIVAASLSARWTLGVVRGEIHKVVLQSSFSEQQIAEGYYIAACFEVHRLLVVSFFLLPSCSLIMSWHLLVLNLTMQVLANSIDSYEYTGDLFKATSPIQFVPPTNEGLAMLFLIFTALVFSLWLMNLLGIALGVEAGIQGLSSAPTTAIVCGVGYAILFYVVFIPLVWIVFLYFVSNAIQSRDLLDMLRIGFTIVMMVLLLWPCRWQIGEVIRSTRRKINRGNSTGNAA